MYEIQCIQCLKKFTVTRNRVKIAKYCSIICCGKAKTAKYLLKRPNFICQECSATFYHKPLGKRPYCSRKCRAIGVGKLKIGVPLSSEIIKKISQAQIGKHRPNITREKHWNWRGGITSKNKLERERFRNEIQKQVFERDNYTCQICFQQGGQLQVDHIQSWEDYIELRFNLNNCRTLCMKCHYFITFNKPMPNNIKTWGHNLKHRMGVA